MTLQFLFNHLGFEAAAAKQVLLQGPAEAVVDGVAVLDAERRLVLRSPLHAAGRVDGWRDWHYWRADIGALRAPGRYQLWLEGSTPPLVSAPFEVADSLFGAPLLSDLLHISSRSAAAACTTRPTAWRGWRDGRAARCPRRLVRRLRRLFEIPQPPVLRQPSQSAADPAAGVESCPRPPGHAGAVQVV
ncbi:hypothetical protein BI344_16695 [Chromobacterium sphagni]|uniref:DUF4178 domain-containing protein n=1 Tax=Chromobacterium sphagni TaxID=1903179 RepID=A0ABX3CBV1_9NEIS|nr:hypothetical protein BI344_16695 [Chromobacterium sphagni]